MSVERGVATRSAQMVRPVMTVTVTQFFPTSRNQIYYVTKLETLYNSGKFPGNINSTPL